MSETLLENVRAYLLADAGLLAIISQRIYPDAAPEGARAVFPYVVYFEVSLASDQHLQGTSGLRECRLQFDIYSQTKAEARSIREHILRLFDGYYGTPVLGGVRILEAMLSNLRSDFDPKERVYSYALDLTFSYTI